MSWATQPNEDGERILGTAHAENLAPDALSENQRKLVELLAENPDTRTSELQEELDLTGFGIRYLLQETKGSSEVFTSHRDETSKYNPIRWRLTDRARRMYERAGIIDDEDSPKTNEPTPTSDAESESDQEQDEQTELDEIAENVEVPSERHEKGNVAYEGPPLDLTAQYASERPVKSTTTDDEDTPKTSEPSPSSDEADPDKPDPEPQRATVSLELERDYVFEILRCDGLPRDVGFAVWNAVVGK